jgi:virginiamycin A acetyltransferase
MNGYLLNWGRDMGILFNILFKLYRYERGFLRNIIFRIILKIDGHPAYSMTLRKIFSHYHKIDIGLYSFGGCFQKNNFGAYTKVGRYCSIAMTAVVINRNHPPNYKSTHAFFFNPKLNICEQDNIDYIPLEIGHDVWLGHYSIIMPHVRKIGTGAIVAAGAVVNKDVPPYAVVVGNPARVVRYRFSPETIEKLLESKWWAKSIEEIKNNELDDYIRPYEYNSVEDIN